MSDGVDEFDDLIFDEDTLGLIDEIEFNAQTGPGPGPGPGRSGTSGNSKPGGLESVGPGVGVGSGVNNVNSGFRLRGIPPPRSELPIARTMNGGRTISTVGSVPIPTTTTTNPFLKSKDKEKPPMAFMIKKPGLMGGVSMEGESGSGGVGLSSNPPYRSPLPRSVGGLKGGRTGGMNSTSTHTLRPTPGSSKTDSMTKNNHNNKKKTGSSSTVIELEQDEPIPIDLCSDDVYGSDGFDLIPMESLEMIDEVVRRESAKQGQKVRGGGPGVGSGLDLGWGGRSGMLVQRELSFGGNEGRPTGSPRSSRISGHQPVNITNGQGTNSLAPISSTTAYQTHLSFQPLGRKKKGKVWDRTEFSVTGGKGRTPNKYDEGETVGGKKKKKKKKGRGVVSFLQSGGGAARDGSDDDEESEEEEEVEGFDQFPLPFIDPRKPPPARKHFPLDYNADTYLYPTNIPRRDYQWEIIASCFMDNTLVALPTGLGKTFIAGTVMLNFFRWFTSGKIVFLMPTKPLVSQQHQACQMTCGIPSKWSATITGDDPEGWRDTAWESKRVFYATPQTFLIDMVKGRVDATDIVLVIVDEAHKASGNHSYVQCIAYLQAVNPFFRIVALTATPGRTTEKVQEVVDKLHISRIEIREAESPDIAKYMFKKNIYHHDIELDGKFEDLVRSMTELMEPLAKALSSTGLIRTPESRGALRYMKPYPVMMAMQGCLHNKSYLKFIGSAKTLHKLSMALTYLMEYSLGMFFTVLRDINGSESAAGKNKTNKKTSRSIKDNKVWKEMYQNTQAMISNGEAHPKFAKVLELLGDHLEAKRVGSQSGENSVTRCMIFCSFREGVNELVEMLNKHPLIRAHKFVGRANGKDGTDKGLTQAEQKSVIEKFKKNEYNCLVATSIGEEGLDIGEVDFIVIYNCPKTSIKALQRIGRAGRKRDGHIHVLATHGREDKNWDAAIFNHRDIQSEIIIGKNLELYDDAPPLLSKMPAPVMQEMNIDPWEDEVKNRGNKRKSKGPAADKAPKRQRGAPVPEGIAGFVKASALTTKGRKTGVRKGKGRAATPMTDSDLDASLPDLNDLEPTVRYSSDSEPKTPASKRKSSSRATATTNRTNSTRKNKKSTRKSFASSSSDEAMAEPSEEEDFDKIVFGGAPPPTLPASSATVNFTNNTQTSDAHGITNDDDQTTPLRPPGHKRHAHDTQQIPVPTTGQSNHSEFSQLDARWMLDLEDDEFQPQMPGAQILAKPFKAPTFKAPSAKATATYGAMGPPSSVRRSSASVPGAAEIPTSDASPIIVRRRGANRPAIAPSSPDPDTSPTTEAGFRPASRMLAATPDTISPVAPARRRKINGRAPNRFIEDDVDVSGEDDGDDDEDDEDDEEDESDRRFAGHFQPTQAPKGYNQSRAYLAGLATQATKDGPAFHDRGHKHTEFLSKARRPILLSQEDTQQGPSSDYEGSFVCGDETIDYDSDMDDDLVE